MPEPCQNIPLNCYNDNQVKLNWRQRETTAEVFAAI